MYLDVVKIYPVTNMIGGNLYAVAAIAQALAKTPDAHWCSSFRGKGACGDNQNI
jgi:hypothetical protein